MCPCVVAEDGALLDGVDRVDDVLLGEGADLLPVVTPNLEQGVLPALVAQRLHEVAPDLRRVFVGIFLVFVLLLLTDFFAFFILFVRAVSVVSGVKIKAELFLLLIPRLPDCKM